MDDFLAKAGREFDPAFVKIHIGTDDLDELLEFTWDKSDLLPLVEAGLKPLLRNKLYRAILEEKAAMVNRRSAVTGSNLESLPADNEPLASPTATPSGASMCETDDNEETSSTTSIPTNSASEASQAPMLSQDRSMLEITTASSGPPFVSKDSSISPREQVTCFNCGEQGHIARFCLKTEVQAASAVEQGSDSGFQANSGIGNAAAFPPLGAPSKSRSVPQATAPMTGIYPGTEKAWAYRTDDRESRRAARMEAGKVPVQQVSQLVSSGAQRVPQSSQRAPKRSLPQPTQASQPAATVRGYGRQFGNYQPMSSAYQSNYAGGFSCPRSCTICYPTG